MYRIEIWRNAAFFFVFDHLMDWQEFWRMELNGKMCVRCEKPVQKEGSTNEERIAPRKNGFPKKKHSQITI
jgi:hypothetical protein